MRRSRRATGTIFAGALFISSLGFSPARADEMEPDAAYNLQQADPAVSSIAGYLSAGADRTGQMLRSLGYSPSIPTQSWNALPAIQKLEQAYVEAELARPGVGGDQMLARLSKDLALRYEAAGHEPGLSNLQRASAPERIPFRSAPRVSVRLPGHVESAVAAIAKYSDGGALGGTSGVLRNHFGLPPERAYDILRTSATNEEALRRGISEVPPAARQARLARTATAVQEVYQGARSDPALTAARGGSQSGRTTRAANRAVDPPFSAASASTGGTPTGRLQSRAAHSGPRPGVQGASRSSVGHGYQSYRTVSYPTASTRRFSTMIRGARGFGGVVFGNEVADDPGLPALSAVSWIPDGSGTAWGRLAFRFADGTERTVSPVLHEDVFAAHGIIYTGVAGVEAAEADEGIGLVGIHEPSPHYVVENNRLRARGRRWQVVMHPAIANLDLGWATLYVDVLPIARAALVDLVERNGSSGDVDGVLTLLAQTPDTWKVTDVPTRIFDDGGQLGVERMPSASGDYPETLRREALIGIEGFTLMLDGSEELIPEFSDAFYREVPSLVHSSRDYDRLNTFARVFALLQWARSDGASFHGTPAEPASVPTPSSVIVDHDAIVPADAFDSDGPGDALRTALPTGGRSLRLGSTVSGSLGVGDLTWLDESPAEIWEIELSEGVVVTVDLESSDFDAYLHVVGPGISCDLADDDGGEGFNARLSFRAPRDGSFRIVARSLGAAGTFQLTAWAGGDAARGCDELPAFESISIGETVSATLSEDDITLRSGTLIEVWEVHGQSAETVWIDLVSTDFDAYLMVDGPGFESPLENDDGGDGCNARIEVTFPETGAYLVVASTITPGDAGAYALTVSARARPAATGVCY